MRSLLVLIIAIGSMVLVSDAEAAQKAVQKDKVTPVQKDKVTPVQKDVKKSPTQKDVEKSPIQKRPHHRHRAAHHKPVRLLRGLFHRH